MSATTLRCPRLVAIGFEVPYVILLWSSGFARPNWRAMVAKSRQGQSSSTRACSPCRSRAGCATASASGLSPNALA